MKCLPCSRLQFTSSFLATRKLRPRVTTLRSHKTSAAEPGGECNLPMPQPMPWLPPLSASYFSKLISYPLLITCCIPPTLALLLPLQHSTSIPTSEPLHLFSLSKGPCLGISWAGACVRSRLTCSLLRDAFPDHQFKRHLLQTCPVTLISFLYSPYQ